MIDAFYDRVEKDDLLSPLFPGGVSETHRDHVTTWWAEVFGGPADYTSQLGGYEAMLAHHRGLDITPEQRFRFASLMSLAADDASLPADPELRAALVGYLEWGTRIAMHNSRTVRVPKMTSALVTGVGTHRAAWLTYRRSPIGEDALMGCFDRRASR